MDNSFFALIARMRYIQRWGLMRNSFREDVQGHSHMTAVIAHALAVIRREQFGGTVDAGAVAVAALYHDAAEIITGDMPTPIKYHNPDITAAYKQVEEVAQDKLLLLLPEELRAAYVPVLAGGSPETHDIVKAADKISAYIKCVEERRAGNKEFESAELQIKAVLDASQLPEVRYFMTKFIQSFGATLDELTA